MDHLHQNGIGVILDWWHLLEYPFHQGVQRWVKELNAFCKSHPALHEIDVSSEGFEWADFKEAESSVISQQWGQLFPLYRAYELLVNYTYYHKEP